MTELLNQLRTALGDIPYLLLVSTVETIYMTFTATFFACLLGIPLGVAL